MPEISTGRLNYTGRDGSDELTVHSGRVPEALDGAAYDALLALYNPYIAALEPLLATQRAKIQIIPQNVVNTEFALPPATAQREIKALVRYRDLTTAKDHRLEIGGIDLTTVTLIADSDLVNLAAGGWAAWKTAFDALFLAPDTGNSTEVQSLQIIGRNT